MYWSGSMHLPRFARALGAAAGGLLGAALLPAGAAFADDYAIVPDPNSTEVVTGYYGLYTALPALDGSALGYQTFDVDDTTLGTTVGSFEADEATTSGIFFGGTNQEILVTSDLSGTAGTGAGDVPPVGSVLDTFTFRDGVFENIYSDLASATAGGDVISDTFVTPFGDFTTPLEFDAAQIPVAELATLVTDSYGITPISDIDVNGVTGIPPLAVATQGPQEFATADGTFDGDAITTWDFMGNATEAILVTSASGTTGTAAGEVPPVGSVFNIATTDFPGYYLVYSDLASTTPGGANDITSTFVTPYGDFAFPDKLDATAIIDAGTASSVPLSDDYEIVSASPEEFTGINGIPPFDVAVQGDQQFDVDNTALGTMAGTFDADVSTAGDGFGDIDKTILVTSDVSGTTGTGAGDVPPVGSVFDTFTFGDSGFENIYSDLASATPGGDVISDTFVTPFGDFTIPATIDAAAGLANDIFLGF
jgi:hypothetical protein